MNKVDNFLKHQGQTTPYSMVFDVEKAEGNYIWDSNGKKYLDLIAGVSACSIGHGHPNVKKAIKEQVDKYLHVMVYGEFIQTPQYDLAMAFAEHLPDSLNSTYFVNSGVESIEASIKLAKRVTGKPQIVSCKNSYHGSTNGALSIMGVEEKKSKFRPLLPECYQIEFNNIESLNNITAQTAGVIVEPVQGATGFVPATKAFLLALRQKCTEVGALLIFDEIQTCFGRLGTMFGFEYYDVIPDVLCIAKGMGGGMPIGAFITSEEHMKTLSHEPTLGHITTFGGHPVCCAASLATWHVLKNSDLLAHIEPKKERLLAKLKHDKIVNINATGLAIGIEFETEAICQFMFDELLKEGIITFFFLFNKTTLRLSPPLTITEEELDWASHKIIELLDKAHAK
ncbi:MAG: aspartate aminotransferase family protein [Flavobacteriales bacterium]